MQRVQKSSSKQETRGDNNNHRLLLSPGSMCPPYAGQASFCISRIQQHSARQKGQLPHRTGRDILCKPAPRVPVNIPEP